MANEENLKKGVPTQFQSGEEAARNGAKGGKASGASRRQTKSLKQAAKIFFGENPNATMEIILAMYQEALGGNVKAVDKLQDLIGETVGREELAMKKKALQNQNKTDNGKAESLIAGLLEDSEE